MATPACKAKEKEWALVVATPEYKDWGKVWKATERASDAYRKILEYKVWMKSWEVWEKIREEPNNEKNTNAL